MICKDMTHPADLIVHPAHFGNFADSEEEAFLLFKRHVSEMGLPEMAEFFQADGKYCFKTTYNSAALEKRHREAVNPE